MLLGQLNKPQQFQQIYSTRQQNQTRTKQRLGAVQCNCSMRTGKNQRLRKKTQRLTKYMQKALEAIDYGFYQKLSVEEVTEDYLWAQRLEPLLDYLNYTDRTYVRKALTLAFRAHNGQFRKSGEPFISHPVEVTRILGELKMDAESLTAGLLHDTVEDTELVTFDLIESEFSSKVRKIVEGETRLSKISGAVVSEKEAKAQDLQQLFITMTEEVRIVVVKLCDRLHNMRTLGSMPAHKQRKISRETAEVFVPLARLLGLYWIKEELEDLSFLYLYPEQHARIFSLLRKLEKPMGPQRITLNDLLARAKMVLVNILQNDPIIGRFCKVDVYIRRKSIYTIFKNNPEPITMYPGSSGMYVDRGGKKPIYQLEVVLSLNEIGVTECEDPSQLCYIAMGKVHSNWQPMPNSIKDYIATPKMNGYRALHTTVFPTVDRSNWKQQPGLSSEGAEPARNPHPKDIPLVELTFRTEEMQLIADYGIAYELRQNSQFTNLMTALPIKEAMSGKLLQQGQKQQRQKIINGVEREIQDGNQLEFLAVNQVMLQRRVNWLNGMKEWQKEFVGSLNSKEFVEGVQSDFLSQKVYVFTPEGDLLHLSAGSTPIDFAYQIHSDIGDQMVGARVNGRLVSPDHVLQNGDVVTILRYENKVTAQMVRKHKQWLDSNFVRTSSAKLKLKKFVCNYADLIQGDDCPAPKNVENAVVEVVVQCDERSGILAEVAQIISNNGYNIGSYSGGSNRDTGVMKYRIEGSKKGLQDLLVQIGKVRGIIAWHLSDTSLLRNNEDNDSSSLSQG
eukprot:TRINITY_DN3953_c0_g1_i2.p1 TRINITY_DN3953_c0_g1~~TRINITY_DN3953_c0_g1_i2.p1  ORF type:complete len:787 (-),score=66.79 TRINITY_DN3953_c0_g1_i2:990-3350(-)